MIRVVLDTNIYISSILTPQGNARTCLRYAFQGVYTLLISQDILREVRRVLHEPRMVKLIQKRGLSIRDADGLIAIIERVAMRQPGHTEVDVIHDDVSDNMFLACAIEGNADYIVSGDRHLLDVKRYQRTQIITLSEFEALLTS